MMANDMCLWHIIDMKKHSTKLVVGSKAFAAISAVEGLKLTAVSTGRLVQQKKQDLSNDKRRQEILHAYQIGK